MAGTRNQLHLHINYFLKLDRTRYAYVVVNFLPQVMFVSLLFWGMVMFANKVEPNEK